MKQSHAVIGLGYGDEGKGHVVDYLCSKSEDPIVVRFSGGPQAAHNVVMEDGRQHVFQHFGSGSFRNVPTFWSRHCPVNPVALIKERNVLMGKGVLPQIAIDRRCPVITPWEIYANRLSSKNQDHGTCGAGIFQTFKRERDNYHLLVEDLAYPEIARLKMQEFAEYHGLRFSPSVDPEDQVTDMEEFFEALGEMADDLFITVSEDPDAVSFFETVIFEGSQGLMLDKDFGFFPYVTPSKTGTQNIIEIGSEFGHGAGWVIKPQLWLVTRAYQTRHGAGYMSPVFDAHANGIKHNPWEQNDNTGQQGAFRKRLLDLDVLNYAIDKDHGIERSEANLVINCLDLMGDEWRLIEDGKLRQYSDEISFVDSINDSLDIGEVYVSHSPVADGIRKTDV